MFTVSHFIFLFINSWVPRGYVTRSYISPDLSTLTTSFSQERELRTLREYSVVAFKILNDESIRIKKLVATFSNNRSSNKISIDTQVQYKNSFTKKTIVDTTNKDQPLVKKGK